MNKWIITVLVILVIAIGFYFGYRQATSGKGTTVTISENKPISTTTSSITTNPIKINPLIERINANYSNISTSYFSGYIITSALQDTSTWLSFSAEQTYASSGDHTLLVDQGILYVSDGKNTLDYGLGTHGNGVTAIMVEKTNGFNSNISDFLPYTVIGVFNNPSIYTIQSTWQEKTPENKTLNKIDIKWLAGDSSNMIITTDPTLNDAATRLQRYRGEWMFSENTFDQYRQVNGVYIPWTMEYKTFLSKTNIVNANIKVSLSSAEVNFPPWKKLESFSIVTPAAFTSFVSGKVTFGLKEPYEINKESLNDELNKLQLQQQEYALYLSRLNKFQKK